MKSCVFGTLFLVIFLSYIHPGFGITTLDDDTYDIFVQMVKGEFNIPVKERTAQQNTARVRFWRNKDKLSLQGGMLCFEGKPIVKKSSQKSVLKNPKDLEQGNFTTNLKILTVAFPSECSRSPLKIHRSSETQCSLRK